MNKIIYFGSFELGWINTYKIIFVTVSSDSEEGPNDNGPNGGGAERTGGGSADNDEESEEEEQQFDISLAASHSVCIR